MSGFGRPPGQVSSKPKPPQRGSFPLDHDGECKNIMVDYLACLKKVRGTNDPECRIISKSYLKCRMDHNLMAPDEFKNLGFQEEAAKATAAESARDGEMATKSITSSRPSN